MNKITELKEDNVSMVGAFEELLENAREVGANVKTLETAVSHFRQWMKEDPGIKL